MKTERRHELQKNVLADRIVNYVQTVRPYGKSLVAVIIGAVAIIYTVTFLSGRQSSQNKAGWDKYYEAFHVALNSSGRNLDLRDLRDVAEDYQGTLAGRWAILAVGDFQLQSGMRLSYRNRAAGEKDLKGAIDNYGTILDQAEQPMLRQRALLGLAQAYESLNDIEEAQSHYKRLASQWPQSILGKVAKDRLDRLSKESSREMYAWYAKQDPSIYRRLSSDSTPPDQPPRPRPIYDDLPMEPDLTLPGPEDLVRPPDELESPDVITIPPPEEKKPSNEVKE